MIFASLSRSLVHLRAGGSVDVGERCDDPGLDVTDGGRTAIGRPRKRASPAPRTVAGQRVTAPSAGHRPRRAGRVKGGAVRGPRAPHSTVAPRCPPGTLDPTATTSRAASTRKPGRSRARATNARHSDVPKDLLRSLSRSLIHLRPPRSADGRRTQADRHVGTLADPRRTAGAQTWKACWVHALAGSNPASLRQPDQAKRRATSSWVRPALSFDSQSRFSPAEPQIRPPTRRAASPRTAPVIAQPPVADARTCRDPGPGSAPASNRQDGYWRMDPMGHVKRFDHVGITVADLASVTAFFVGLGLELEGTGSVEGEFADTVCEIRACTVKSRCCGRPTEDLGWSSPASSARRRARIVRADGQRARPAQRVVRGRRSGDRSRRCRRNGTGSSAASVSTRTACGWPMCVDPKASSSPCSSRSADARPRCPRACTCPPPGRPQPHDHQELRSCWEAVRPDLIVMSSRTCHRPGQSSHDDPWGRA